MAHRQDVVLCYPFGIYLPPSISYWNRAPPSGCIGPPCLPLPISKIITEYFNLPSVNWSTFTALSNKLPLVSSSHHGGWLQDVTSSAKNDNILGFIFTYTDCHILVYVGSKFPGSVERVFRSMIWVRAFLPNYSIANRSPMLAAALAIASTPT